MPRKSTTTDSPLTPQQIAVLRALAEGMTPAEIAAEMKLKRRTIQGHIHFTYVALGVHNAIQAVGRAHRMGLLPNLYGCPGPEPSHELLEV